MHWTYESADPGKDLMQGDLLLPTESLRGCLAEVHPHFDDNKYLGFVVATQSCDLALRHGQPSVGYIAIASVRPLATVLPKLLESVAKPVAPAIFVASSRGDANQLLQRILNQNEQALGLFYLHPDADVGLGESAVAFLRVVVSLRAEHYEALREARTCHLAQPFRGKLGWLLGNLYARAASPDWADHQDGEKVFKATIRELIDSPSFNWLEDEIARAAIDNDVSLTGADFPVLREKLEELRPPTAVDQVVKILITEAEGIINSKDGSIDLEVLGNRLRNNGHLSKLMRRLRPEKI